MSPVGAAVQPTDRIICQGKALVGAIEALETIEPTGPFERGITWLQLQAYRRRPRAIVELVPAWLGEEILSASQAVGRDRAAVWLSEI